MQVCSICQRRYDDTVSSCSEGCDSILSPASENDGATINGYQLGSHLQTGYGVELYRAQELSSGSPCLIRIISPTVEKRSELLREAKLAASLFHPNIVDTFQAGTIGEGEVFVVSEDPDGQTLRSYLDNFGVPKLLTSVEIIRQAAEAIHALHSSGLMHRAINPENIILTKDADGDLLVRVHNPDLGAVVQDAIMSNKFSIDNALGALRYFAPEQCSSEEATVRTDVYSLGVVFYEMLAGTPPFDAASATALIHKHRNQAPADIRIDNFDLRMLVTHCLTESLQKPYRLRQSSAGLFARQLRHIEQLATHSSTPPPAGTVRTQESGKMFTPPFIPREQPAMVDVESPVEIVPEPVLEVLRAVETEVPAATIVEVVTEREVLPVPDEVAVRPIPIPETTLPAHIESSQPVWLEPAYEAEIAVEPEQVIEPAAPRRSRLRGLKKKLHTLASKLAAEAESRQAIVSIVEEPALAVPDTIEVKPQAEEAVAAIAPATEEPVQELVAEAPPVVAVAAEEPAALSIDLTAVAETVPVEEATAEEATAEEAPAAAPVIDTADESTKAVTNRESRPKARSSAPAKPRLVKPVKVWRDLGLRDEVADVRPARSVSRVPLVEADDEEITLVRPPQRIQIDLEPRHNRSRKNNASRPVPETLAFLPTILGGGRDGEIASENSTGMFSNYAPTLAAPTSSRRRTALLICTFVALGGLLLFGNDSVTRYFQSWSSADSTAVRTGEAPKPIPAASTVSTLKSQPVPKVEKTKAVAAQPKEKSEDEKVVKATTSSRPAAVSEKPKTKTAEPEKKPAEKRVVTTSQPAPHTRPRVVQNPR